MRPANRKIIDKIKLVNIAPLMDFIGSFQWRTFPGIQYHQVKHLMTQIYQCFF